eukprot:scaffold7375_cov268-Pinguiococcus_pyrenoidosus.AAC.63
MDPIRARHWRNRDPSSNCRERRICPPLSATGGFRRCFPSRRPSFPPSALQVRAGAMGNKLSRCPELAVPELPEGYAVATLALGCFWGPDKEFRDTKGIVNVVVGYTGGKGEPLPAGVECCLADMRGSLKCLCTSTATEPNPTYKNIKDHTEAVRITVRSSAKWRGPGRSIGAFRG